MQNKTTVSYGGYKPYSNPDPRLHADYLLDQYKMLDALLNRKLAQQDYIACADIRAEKTDLIEVLKSKGVNVSDVRTA